ncbi:putative EF-hand domain-containing protein [Helianthus anomalus]
MSKLMAVDQRNQLRDIFNRFDMDADGSLTHLELAALLRSLGLEPSGDQIYMLFNKMDSNGNGAVEFEELVNAMSPNMMTEQNIINQKLLLKVFHLFDQDGNGFITPSELALAMAKMGQPLTDRELTEMIEEADTDGDGVISFSEFARVMAKSAAESFGSPVPSP